ncbi:MAG: 30S ribosomal protein S27e [archaeon]|nr:30S ribosomal protein S27e [archaeon]
MVNEFVKVKCADCGNEQITFRKASMNVKCNVCGTVLVKPKGGNAEIAGEIVEVFN